MDIKIYSFQNLFLNLYYRIADIDRKYYLVPTQQSFIQRLLFFFNWLRPIRAYQINKVSAEKFIRTKEPKRNQFKTLFGMFLGLGIGRFVFALANQIVLSGLMSRLVILSIIMIGCIILFQVYLPYLANKRLEKMGISQEVQTQIKIRPLNTKLSWIQIVFIFMLGHVLCVATINSFVRDGNATSLLVLIISLVFVVYSALIAFFPGLYTYKEVSRV